jgi:hypothetical protein
LLGWTLGRLRLGFCLLHAQQIEKRGEGIGLEMAQSKEDSHFLSLFLFSVFPNFCTILKVELVLENYRNISDLPIRY